ncbi:MAG: restriction endonuclease subunit S [Lewinellaceae bacterium]|nr:restriction endonuclease subunit S [Lewinellaceae bacterium]
MGNEWKEVTLREISSDISYGYTQSASEEVVGPHFLRITDIQGGTVDWKNVPYCQISEDDLEKYRLLKGDIVVARTGNSTGENYLYNDEKDAVFASYLIKFRIKSKIADPQFIWYNMRSKKWWGFINSSKTGSAQAGANAKVLGRFSILLPPLPEQKAVAHILGAFDDKIALNRRQNDTLEQMAQALFQSWFVDFDPVIDKALAAGKPIPESLQARAERRKALGNRRKPLPTEIQALFPDGFGFEEELGWVPEGWRVGRVEELANVIGGGTPSKKVPEYFSENGIAWLTPKDLSGYQWKFISRGATDISPLGLKKSSAKLMPKGTVLFSSRAPIGYIAITENEIATNQGFKSLVPKKPVPSEYLFYFLKSNIDRVESFASGSTFKEVSGSAVKALSILIPSKEILGRYEKETTPFNERRLSIQKESEYLTQLRDTLLPKLISGELRLSELMANY